MKKPTTITIKDIRKEITLKISEISGVTTKINRWESKNDPEEWFFITALSRNVITYNYWVIVYTQNGEFNFEFENERDMVLNKKKILAVL